MFVSKTNAVFRFASAGRLAMLGLVMSYRGKAPSPEVMDRMKEIAMGSQMWIEGNPILEPSFNKGKAEGKAEGEARGILIGKAMSHDAPEPVIEAIRQCPAENLAAMGKRVDEATRTSDWSEIAAVGPSVR